MVRGTTISPSLRVNARGKRSENLPGYSVTSEPDAVRSVKTDHDIAFVYGTLMQGFPLHRLIEGRAEYLGQGTVAARLIDLGAYPAAVADAHGAVVGEVYR